LGFLTRFRIGDGSLTDELRSKLEAEGLVLVEEGLAGSVRYTHFKAPGRRHHGKVSREKIVVGISEERLAVYCRSGLVELVDASFDNPRLALLAISLHDEGELAVLIDSDRAGVGDGSGQIAIRAKTPNAASIAEQLNARIDAV